MKALRSIALIGGLQLISAPIYAQSSDSLFAGLTEKEYLTGKFEAAQLPTYFTKLPFQYSEGEQWLRTEAVQAFIQMANSAQKDGIMLKAVSGFRSFFRQKLIWEAKWTGKRKVEGLNLRKAQMPNEQKAVLIMRYSSMPGTSRHHWGTDLDINSVDEAYFNSPEGSRTYAWLTLNAPKFGFCQVYHQKQSSGRSGYEEEKWHWTYLPLSIPLTQKYGALISNQEISGFLGHETAPAIRAVETYVLGLNLDCIK